MSGVLRLVYEFAALNRVSIVGGQDQNLGFDSVTTFRIDTTTGALTEVGTAVAAGDGPYSITTLGQFE